MPRKFLYFISSVNLPTIESIVEDDVMNYRLQLETFAK